MKDDKGRKMVSCQEAAREYGCSMRYIRKLVSAGRIGSELVGRSYLVCLDDVKKLSGRKADGRLKKRSTGFKSG